MNTEEHIRRHLQVSTETLEAPDRLEDVMREGGLRRIRRNTAAVLGAAALLSAVVGIAANLAPRGDETIATSPGISTATSAPAITTSTINTTTTVPGVVAQVPAGVLVANATGVTFLGQDGEVDAAITGDPIYPVALAFTDQMGGVVFQHATTPPPWDQGTLLWLRAGAESPEPVAVPFPHRRLIPVGSASAPEAPRPSSTCWNSPPGTAQRR